MTTAISSSSLPSYTPQEKEDLKELFRLFDFSKVGRIDSVIADAQQRGLTAAEMFDDLYSLFKVRKLPQRDAVLKRLRMAVPDATDNDIQSVLRQTEMKGLAERDAVRSLERKYHVSQRTLRTPPFSQEGPASPQCSSSEFPVELAVATDSFAPVSAEEAHRTCSTSLGATAAPDNVTRVTTAAVAHPSRRCSAAAHRCEMDDVMAAEIRDWLAEIVGPVHCLDVISSPNFIEALRSGVLLHVLLQKMESPPVADSDLVLPKRAAGFFARDNVAAFLAAVKERYNILDAQLFTVSDLVDGKGERQVVTCLMALARAAYAAGTINTAPSMIRFEHEIAQQEKRLKETGLYQIFQEVDAENSFPSSSSAAVFADGVPGDAGRTETQETAKPLQREASPSLQNPIASRNSAVSRSLNLCEDQRSPSFPEERAIGDALQEIPYPPPSPDLTDLKAAASSGCVSIETAAAVNLYAPPREDKPLIPFLSSGECHHSNPDLQAAELWSGKLAAVAPHIETPAVPNNASSFLATSPEAAEDDETSGYRGPSITAIAELASDTDTPSIDLGAASTTPQNSTESSKNSARVYYLRGGAILSSRPPSGEARRRRDDNEKNKETLITRKHTDDPLAATQPPRHHCHHWDGIDVALGHRLNEHYKKYAQSPWRFRSVHSISGMYTVYNRVSAHKSIVHVRIIQDKLLVRNSGEVQRWISLDEALEAMEKIGVKPVKKLW